MPANPMVAGYLQAASEDLDAARRLLTSPPNRLASYHLQQASEKLAKAVLSLRGIQPTKEHRLSLIVAQLSTDDPWRSRLQPLEHLDRFATTFRYPGTTGRLAAGEDLVQAQRDLELLQHLIDVAGRE